jgi:hypothetical protein
MDDIGFWVEIIVRDPNGNPVPNIIPSDIWLISCAPSGELLVCQEAFIADSSTNANGRTTISGRPLKIGGCGEGLAVVVLAQVILENCSTWKCAPIAMRSGDIDADRDIDLVDLSLFAQSFVSGNYDSCCDFNYDGVINLQDFSIFAFHYGHYCL